MTILLEFKMKGKYTKKGNEKKTEIVKTIEDSEKEIIDMSGVERIKRVIIDIPRDSERKKKVKKLRR